MEKSSSIIVSGSNLGYEEVKTEQSFRRQEFEYKKQISDLSIKLESEKKRNEHLEQNYLNLPTNIKELEILNENLRIAQGNIASLQLEKKNAEDLALKYKKDLDAFREFAFKEIKDKEFTIIELGSVIRNFEEEKQMIKNQSQRLLEEYENLLKKSKLYKQKYRKLKSEVNEYRLAARNNSINKQDMDYINLKLELASAQKRITDLTISREDLAKKYSDLELKNQQLNVKKSDFRSRVHKQTKTLTEMELDFQDILEGIETEKSEEVSDLLTKIAGYEKLIKDMEKSHENIIANKQEEIAKEKFNIEELKRQYNKLEKNKHKLELDLNASKQILNDHNSQLVTQQIEFEAKIENIVKENNEKVLKYKGQIHDLELKVKELQEANDITRKSLLVGESLFDELNELNQDFRDSRPSIMKNLQESIFKQFEETDSKVEKQNEKIEKLRQKNKNLKNETQEKVETINELEKEIKKLKNSNKEKDDQIQQNLDSLTDFDHKLKNLETEKEHREKEISRLKDQNNELTKTSKENLEKFIACEAEIVRVKGNFEENLKKLKEKYSGKILRYKEEIMALNEKCTVREDFFDESTEDKNGKKDEVQKILKKNLKLKEKNESLMHILKTKTEIISKLQSKLREFYSIPKVDENLEEFKTNLTVIKEESEDYQDFDENSGNNSDLLALRNEYNGKLKFYKNQIEELIQVNQQLRELGQVKHEIMIVSEIGQGKIEEKQKDDEEINEKCYKTDFVVEKTGKCSIKVETLKKNIYKIAKDLNFSTEIISSNTKKSLKTDLEEPLLITTNNQNTEKDVLGLFDQKAEVFDRNKKISDKNEEIFDKNEEIFDKKEEIFDKNEEISEKNNKPEDFSDDLFSQPKKTDIYVIKDYYPDDYAELLQNKYKNEELINNLKLEHETEVMLLRKQINRKSDSKRLSTRLSSNEAPNNGFSSQNPEISSEFEEKIKDLEYKVFELEQDLQLKSERYKKNDLESRKAIEKLLKFENLYIETDKKLKDAEELIKKYEDYQPDLKKSSIDEEYSDTEEDINRGSRMAAVSVMETFEEITENTEGSFVEEESLKNPFEAFKQSLIYLGKGNVNQDNKIQNLEVELSERLNDIRQLQEIINDLKRQITVLEGENSQIKLRTSDSERKLHEFTMLQRKANESNDSSHDWVMMEAKMTLLEAHNQRLETEIIISKTN